LDSGRLRPSQPSELSAALVRALIIRLRDFLTELTQEVWQLERKVTAGHMGDPEDFLDELFEVISESSTTNSSPPNRPAVCLSRIDRTIALATASRTALPARCP
jgi:hypothetical protein